jgi:hypothetical protein
MHNAQWEQRFAGLGEFSSYRERMLSVCLVNYVNIKATQHNQWQFNQGQNQTGYWGPIAIKLM